MLFRDLEFSLDSGQVLQVKGGNGSGKTTLLRIICGLNDGFEGEIFWQGASPAQARERFHAELLYIGHRAGVNKVLTPLENLRWGCSLHRVVADADIRSALAETGLAGYEESQCFTLSARTTAAGSTGPAAAQRSRFVGIGRAIYHARRQWH